MLQIFDLSEVMKHGDIIVLQMFDLSEVAFAVLMLCPTNIRPLWGHETLRFYRPTNVPFLRGLRLPDFGEVIYL